MNIKFVAIAGYRINVDQIAYMKEDGETLTICFAGDSGGGPLSITLRDSDAPKFLVLIQDGGLVTSA